MIVSDTDTSIQWEKVTDIYELPEFIKDGLKSIFYFNLLSENWDSYGSPPPSEIAITLAERILKGPIKDIINLQISVTPVSGGGIQIILKGLNRELDFLILPSGEVEYLQCENEICIDEGEIQNIDSLEIPRKLNWVSSEDF